MRNLEDIWSSLKPGDKVLMQKISDGFSEPRLVTIVGIDVWDMAMVVYFTDYKDFNSYNFEDCIPADIKIHSFAEWTEYWNVLGHWQHFPNFRELLSAYRLKE